MLRLVLFVSILGVFVTGRVVTESKQTSTWDDGRIVGGRNATIEEFPYQLSFLFDLSHRCGASLIRPNVIVTAAHCTAPFLNYPELITIRAGSTIRESGGQVASIIDICDHPKYNFPDYDVSVLLLDRSFKLDASTQLISLQPINAEIPNGAIATVTGWGYLEHEGFLSRILQAVEVPKIDDSSCLKSYPEDLTARMICFGYEEGGKDSCQGDSGGPLVLGGKLAGVVSWGDDCAAPKYPGVYAKVSNPEIHNHINSCIEKFTL